MAVVFLKIGQDLHISGGLLCDAVNEGVRRGYKNGYLRKSVVADPVRRGNTGDNTPAIIHTEIVEGDNIEITIAPKGFGSENMSRVFMLKPADGIEGVKEAILTAVKDAGPNACPPMVVGVGIGGTFEKCAFLAKKALTRNLHEKPEKDLWRERLIANAQLVEYGDKAAEIVDFAIIDHKGMITSSVDKNQRFRIKMKIKFHETMEHPIFAFSIKDRKGTEITGTNTALEDYTKDVVEAGKTVTVCFDQIMPLQSGQYLMSFGCTSYHLEELVIHHRLYDACFLEVFSMKDTVGFFDMNSTVTYE